MGEIVCSKCDRMYSHLEFHDGRRTSCICGHPLGMLCPICNERVCESCHLYEHWTDEELKTIGEELENI